MSEFKAVPQVAVVKFLKELTNLKTGSSFTVEAHALFRDLCDPETDIHASIRRCVKCPETPMESLISQRMKGLL